jgi:hypothetical protein
MNLNSIIAYVKSNWMQLLLAGLGGCSASPAVSSNASSIFGAISKYFGA